MLDCLSVSKVLVIAPLRVARDTWPAEIRKWDHLKDLDVSVIVGDAKTRTAAINRPAMVYIINRENTKWLVEYYEKNGRRWDFDCVVIDELSSFKNHQSQRFKWLRKIRPYVKRWIGLTGTPTSNGLMDLWAEIGILDGGERLGRFIGRYREAYFRPGAMNPHTGIVYQYTIRPGAEEQIYRKISDITISMKALDYLKMPEYVSVTHEVQMNPAERDIYDRMKNDLIIPLEDGDIDAVNAASLSNKLLQMSNGAVYDENQSVRLIHQRKLEMLEDLIEAANGQPVLVAYWFRHDKARIQEYLKSIGCETREIKESKDIQDWNAGKISVALIHPASAGHGLNIQDGGHILIWFGLTWSLELYMQANARLWRQGQKNTVTIHHIITKGTVDEDVMAALEAKDVTQEKLIAAVKARLS
jgi:SNF2 family DNA or RNA helicase